MNAGNHHAASGSPSKSGMYFNVRVRSFNSEWARHFATLLTGNSVCSQLNEFYISARSRPVRAADIEDERLSQPPLTTTTRGAAKP
jgi:hypothetical protein